MRILFLHYEHYNGESAYKHNALCLLSYYGRAKPTEPCYSLFKGEERDDLHVI